MGEAFFKHQHRRFNLLLDLNDRISFLEEVLAFRVQRPFCRDA